MSVPFCQQRAQAEVNLCGQRLTFLQTKLQAVSASNPPPGAIQDIQIEIAEAQYDLFLANIALAELQVV